MAKVIRFCDYGRVIRFPDERRMNATSYDEPAKVIVLPVVRVERKLEKGKSR